jgi:hypothetical protein
VDRDQVSSLFSLLLFQLTNRGRKFDCQNCDDKGIECITILPTINEKGIAYRQCVGCQQSSTRSTCHRHAVKEDLKSNGDDAKNASKSRLAIGPTLGTCKWILSSRFDNLPSDDPLVVGTRAAFATSKAVWAREYGIGSYAPNPQVYQHATMDAIEKEVEEKLVEAKENKAAEKAAMVAAGLSFDDEGMGSPPPVNSQNASVPWNLSLPEEVYEEDDDMDWMPQPGDRFALRPGPAPIYEVTRAQLDAKSAEIEERVDAYEKDEVYQATVAKSEQMRKGEREKRKKWWRTREYLDAKVREIEVRVKYYEEDEEYKATVAKIDQMRKDEGEKRRLAAQP